MGKLSLYLAPILLLLIVVPTLGEAQVMIKQVVTESYKVVDEGQCIPLGGFCDRQNPNCCGIGICLGRPARCEHRCLQFGAHCDHRNNANCCANAACVGYPGRCDVV